MPAVPNKGHIEPLKYSEVAKERVVIGLRWDPNLKAVKTNKVVRAVRGGIMGENDNAYDLDIACVMYDSYKEAIDGVSGRADETIDRSGHVYHSGDDMSGHGDHDDEAISIELKEFPDDVEHIVFVVEIQSGHTFGEVNTPEVRIADAKTDEDQFFIPLDEQEGSDENTAFVFARVFKQNNQWMIHYIGDYLIGEDVEDWIDTLDRYIG